MCRLSWNLGASTSWNHLGLSRPVMGLLYLHLNLFKRWWDVPIRSSSVWTHCLDTLRYYKHSVTLPKLSVWFRVVRPIFSAGTVTVAECLNMLHKSTIPHYSSPVWRYQHVASTRTPPHYDRDVTTYIGNSFPDHWQRTQRICWFIPMITRYNPIWPFLLTLHKVCSAQHTAQRTPRAPARNWSIAWLSKQKIWWPLVKSLTQRRQLCHEANSGYFEHLHKIH